MTEEDAGAPERGSLSQSEAALLEGLKIAQEKHGQDLQQTLAPFSMEEIFADAIAESNAELLESQLTVNEAVLSDVAEELAESQWMVNQAVQSAVSEDLQRLNTVLFAAINNLNVPSIEADLHTISQSHQEQRDSPYDAIDSDRRSESSLPTETNRDRRDWYRQRSVEIAVTVVDYLFWKAKQGNELTEASDEEVAVAMFIAALFLTSLMNGGPSLTSAAGAAKGVELGQKAVRNRSERRNLDEKFLE